MKQVGDFIYQKHFQVDRKTFITGGVEQCGRKSWLKFSCKTETNCMKDFPSDDSEERAGYLRRSAFLLYSTIKPSKATMITATVERESATSCRCSSRCRKVRVFCLPPGEIYAKSHK